ncbi:MAG TPA: hypothetical protein VEA40_07400 [Ramlibacter sp.]|nr:hypothetical protein [Ramlibacter sp.]
MNPAPHDGYFEAYWPRGVRRVTTRQLAPRLPTLEGKRIAFAWDYVFRGDVMFDEIRKQFSARYPGVSFVGHEEMGNIHGSDERAVVAALPGRLKAKGVDAVIIGVAA